MTTKLVSRSYEDELVATDDSDDTDTGRAGRG